MGGVVHIPGSSDESLGRIATALERIADTLEERTHSINGRRFELTRARDEFAQDTVTAALRMAGGSLGFAFGDGVPAGARPARSSSEPGDARVDGGRGCAGDPRSLRDGPARPARP